MTVRMTGVPEDRSNYKEGVVGTLGSTTRHPLQTRVVQGCHGLRGHILPGSFSGLDTLKRFVASTFWLKLVNSGCAHACSSAGRGEAGGVTCGAGGCNVEGGRDQTGQDTQAS